MNYRSNEICKEIQVEDKEIQLTIPSDKATKAEIESWASANGVTVSFTEVADEAKKGTNEIISNGVKVNGDNDDVHAVDNRAGPLRCHTVRRSCLRRQRVRR